MKLKRYLIDSATVFAVTLVASAIVTLLWNRIVDGVSVVDWETSFRSAVLFGIILPWVEARRGG